MKKNTIFVVLYRVANVVIVDETGTEPVHSHSAVHILDSISELVSNFRESKSVREEAFVCGQPITCS